MTHVLLAVPSYKYGLKGLHLGLAYIAATLRDIGFSVAGVDASAEGLCEDAIRQLLATHNPRVVGISCTASNYMDAVSFAALVKDSSDAAVVVGGPQTSFTASESLKCHPEFDVIVRHEGELTMKELVAALSSGQSLDGIQGISYRSKSGICETPDRNQIEDLDSLPFPARDLFPSSLYSYGAFPGKRATSVTTSRGCPYSCVFCTQSRYAGKLLRSRSVRNVMKELEEIKRTGYEAVYFEDSTFTIRRKRTTELCQGLATLGLQWGCDTRIDTLDRELVRLMADAGCTAVFFGIESMDPDVQRWIGKTYDNDEMMAIVADCRNAGITANCSLQFGFPGETIETVRECLLKAKQIGFDSVDVSILTIYPGSQLATSVGLTPGDYERALKYPPTEYHFHGMERVYFPGVTPEFIADVYHSAAEILTDSWRSSGFYVEDTHQLGSEEYQWREPECLSRSRVS